MNDKSLIQQRNDALRQAYTNIMAVDGVSVQHLKHLSVATLIAQQPAPRFYITPEIAGWYICQFYRDNRLPLVKPHKRQMIKDLIAVYERWHTRFPEAQKSVLCQLTVESPAPSFYLRPKRIKEIIFNYTYRNGNNKK